MNVLDSVIEWTGVKFLNDLNLPGLNEIWNWYIAGIFLLM
jgi:hypothetical protein